MTTDVKQTRWQSGRTGLAAVLVCLLVVLIHRREGVVGLRAIADAAFILTLILVGIWKHGDFEPFGRVLLAFFLVVALQ